MSKKSYKLQEDLRADLVTKIGNTQNSGAADKATAKRFRILTARAYVVVSLFLSCAACHIVHQLLFGTVLVALAPTAAGFVSGLVAWLVITKCRFHYIPTVAKNVGFFYGIWLFLSFYSVIIGIEVYSITYMTPFDFLILAIFIALGICANVLLFAGKSIKKIFNVCGFVLVPVFFVVATVACFTMSTDLTQISNYSVRYRYTVDDNAEAIIEGYSEINILREYIVPEAIDGKPVTTLGQDFASEIKGIHVIELPATIKKIYPTAFSKNTNINSVVYNGTEINDLMFLTESAVRELSFPNDCSNLVSHIVDTDGIGEVSIKVPVARLNDYRRQLFDMGENYSVISGATEDVYVINFCLNNGQYIDSAVGSSAQDVIAAATQVLSDTYTYTDASARRDYFSAGWYSTAEFLEDSKVDIGSLNVNEKQITLYLRWVPIYKITMSKGEWTLSESFDIDSFTVVDENIDLPVAVLAGKTFRGWYTDKNYSVPIDYIDTSYEGDITLYPRFIDNYDIVYDWDGASPVEGAITYYHSEMTAELPRPEKAGYNFEGWYREPDYYGEPLAAIEEGMVGALSLKAKFEPIIYTISFDTDGGSGVEKFTYTIEDSDLDLSRFVTSRDGFVFESWLHENNEVTVWTVTSLTDVVLTARWRLDDFSFALDNSSAAVIYGDIASLGISEVTELAADAQISYSYNWYVLNKLEWERLADQTSDKLYRVNVVESGQYKLIITAQYTKTGEIKTAEATEYIDIKPRSISNAEIVLDVTSDFVYCGDEIIPDIIDVVIDGISVDWVYYHAVYSNNINVGTATVTAVGTGNFSDSAITTFEIVPRDISCAEITLEEDHFVYNGNEIYPDISNIVVGDLLLTSDDYGVEYMDNIDAGEARIIITGMGNYTGSINVCFTISPLPIIVEWLAPADLVYDGQMKTPSAAVSNLVNGDQLVLEIILATGDGVNVGNPFTYCVTAINNNNYTLQNAINLVSPEYEIQPRNIAGAEIVLDNSEFVYSGKEICPEIISIEVGGIFLSSDDYEVQYSNNINVGAATITVEGKGNFAGNEELSFEIVPKSIDDAIVKVDMSSMFVYNGQEICPEVVEVVAGNTVLGTFDYDISYSDNVNAGWAKVTITGKGNYAGSVTEDFYIEKACPDYNTPDEIEAVVGQKLSDLPLPLQWGWKEPDMVVEQAGKNIYKAVFTPEDTDNYKVIEVDLVVNAYSIVEEQV